MPAKSKTYQDIMKMAADYGVDDNALFVSTAEQYELQRKVIKEMRKSITKGDPLVTKEYVKGRENVMAHPFIQLLPKHIDSANKTLGTMLDIIERLGAKKAVGDKLSGFLKDE